jgi:pimeloyl-ACP methyl ester carboxylesterase
VTGPLRPPRVPEAVFAACGYFLPRLLFLNSRYAPQVHWGDIALALDGFPDRAIDLTSAEFWAEWRTRWEAQGDRYAQLARESSTAAGRARAQRGAAACYHWAEFMYFEDAEVKHRLRTRIRELTRASLEGGELEVVSGELPAADAESAAVPYWLLLPPQRPPAGRLPCAILSNGLDSMTEVEVVALAEGYLERGIAALVFDGPGQGAGVGRTPLRTDMEGVVAQLVERLGEDDRIDVERLAFVGISFGGYLALRVAQALGSWFRCVVNLSGGPVISPFEGLPRRLKSDFRFAFMCHDEQDMQAQFDKLRIDPSRPVETDVLSVHGARDDIFPVAALIDLDRAWGERHRLVVHEREAHVCLNLINSVSLEAADWVADRLLPAPMKRNP